MFGEERSWLKHTVSVSSQSHAKCTFQKAGGVTFESSSSCLPSLAGEEKEMSSLPPVNMDLLVNFGLRRGE